MAANLVQIPSLTPIIEKVIAQVEARHDVALIAAPGSGSTTLGVQLGDELSGRGLDTSYFDFRSPKEFAENMRRLEGDFADGDPETQKVAIIDHANDLLSDDFQSLLKKTAQIADGRVRNYLWVGPLDARVIFEEHGVRINSVPKSHICFPNLQRDELLSIYRFISTTRDCNWGDAILFLILDWCGNDLALVEGLTEFLHGKWTDNLYDESVWDRVDDWLRADPHAERYRQRLRELSEHNGSLIQQLSLGAKPPCHREDIYQETDGGLRSSYLKGVLVQNLLPTFYQLRNLLVRYLLLEQSYKSKGFCPKILFRRFTNERVGQLLQDAETMVRSVLSFQFQQLGEVKVREILSSKQADGEFMSADLNKALLTWAESTGGRDLRESLNSMLVEKRKEFRDANTLWEKAASRMAKDDVGKDKDKELLPDHVRCIEYLTLYELSVVFLDMLESIFTKRPKSDYEFGKLIERWRESLAKIQRMRNQVAHLRNIHFQDVEDIVRTIESMRKDLLLYVG